MSPRLMLVACGLMLAPAAAHAESIYGVTEEQFLVSWDSAMPGNLMSGMPITGLQSNETILGIDFRPATGELFAVGSSSRLYTLSTSTGAATMVGSGPFSPPINGSSFGFDFNPTIDRIRFVSDVNKNYVLNPNDGMATEVTDVFFPMGDANAGTDPNVVHSAYTNSFNNATTTQLYGVDAGLDLLVTQANSAGTLGTVGVLGTDVTSTGGFDISGATGVGYMAIEDSTTSRTTFWTVDLMTGLGTPVGEVGGGAIITAIAVAPIPEPTSATLLVASVLGTGFLRRARK
ncbi:DUF4394 domain-containing protein [Botrimarina mediterranea]|uniref:DUF4394 domain-containing protein n=1 Tax=Botrimarina mediterranea TaxID=2528022 RepID=A0A518K3Z0_9BACT|nr:DUF4394 domain-containing protein [Botrimarina mediterranea]QDV72528.1 hypothetical protein Spa11_07060 [Botrimarina mediterranea]QDV77100.1 hypothetical protein K2D_06870 [Planctomycetes bacterium K2D]